MASGVLLSEDLETVIMEAEETQRRLGDCLSRNSVSQLPEMKEFELKQNNLTKLSQIWQEWPTSRQHQFNKKYGHIGHLLSVTIETQMLRAMIQIWDPPYQVFTFNTIDMTPTIEEYAALLSITSSATDKVYRYEPKHKFKRSLAKIMGIHAANIALPEKKKGESQCEPVDFLFDFLQKHSEDDKGMSVMALAIYDMIIFPKVLGHIEDKVINFFEQVEHRMNHVPAILAETFCSLNYCRSEGEGRFIRCAQLLHIWMKSHFECLDPKFVSPYRHDKSPIMEFCLSKWPDAQHKHVWIETFRHLNKEEVIWIPPWMLRDYMLYKCRDFNWVPLLRPWGGISYAPALARRQFGSKQFIPVTHGLSQLEFSYGDDGSAKLVKEIISAWGQTHRVRPGRYTDAVTDEYFTWHEKRGKGFLAPKVYGPDLPVQRVDEPEDYRTEIEARYEIATQSLQKDNAKLILENQKLQAEMKQWKDTIERARKRVRQLNRYVDSITTQEDELKKENADLQDTVKELNDKIKNLSERIGDLQTNLNIKAVDCDTAIEQSHDLWASIRSLNQQIGVQFETIQGLQQECEKLKRECCNFGALKNGYGLFYSQVDYLLTQIQKVARRAQIQADQVETLLGKVMPENTYGQELIYFLTDIHRQLSRLGRIV